MIKGNRQHVVLDVLPNLKWARTSAHFGEPLVQVTTPQVALNCLICPPSGNYFDNSAPQLSFFSKNNQLIKASIQALYPGYALWSHGGQVFLCSFQMTVSGAFGCFPGEIDSKGIFLEPASVAPSLQVFALNGYDHHASVRALAEIASGWFETDSKGTFLPSRCDMCGLIRFWSRPSCGLTWRGSCPYLGVPLLGRDARCVAYFIALCAA